MLSKLWQRPPRWAPPLKFLATEFVGIMAVPGLPQREDHCLAVEAIAESLGRDISDISLSQGDSRPENIVAGGTFPVEKEFPLSLGFA